MGPELDGIFVAVVALGVIILALLAALSGANARTSELAAQLARMEEINRASRYYESLANDQGGASGCLTILGILAVFGFVLLIFIG